jgi:hypothetical protein
VLIENECVFLCLPPKKIKKIKKIKHLNPLKPPSSPIRSSFSFFFNPTHRTSEYTDYLVNASVDFTNVFLGNWTANIHRGYVAAVESVYGGVIDVINELDPDNTNDIVITGHSLGGALASVAAALLQADQYFLRYIYGIYTFGSPRVGDASWVDAYYNLGLWDKTLRYANKRDPIPAIPSRSSGFAHVGLPVIIDEGKKKGNFSHRALEDVAHMCHVIHLLITISVNCLPL